MTVGERIKELRTSLGLSQVDFADKINVSKQTLYKYENNIIANIPSDKIEAAARLGNISPAYIMGWIDSPATLVSIEHNSPDPKGVLQRMSLYTAKFLELYNQLSSPNKEKVVSYTKGLLSTQQMEEDVRMAQAHTNVLQDAEPEAEIIDVDTNDIESKSSVSDAYVDDGVSNIIDVIRDTDDIVEDEYPAPNAANDRKATSKQKAHADNIMKNDSEWI